MSVLATVTDWLRSHTSVAVSWPASCFAAVISSALEASGCAESTVMPQVDSKLEMTSAWLVQSGGVDAAAESDVGGRARGHGGGDRSGGDQGQDADARAGDGFRRDSTPGRRCAPGSCAVKGTRTGGTVTDTACTAGAGPTRVTVDTPSRRTLVPVFEDRGPSSRRAAGVGRHDRRDHLAPLDPGTEHERAVRR